MGLPLTGSTAVGPHPGRPAGELVEQPDPLCIIPLPQPYPRRATHRLIMQGSMKECVIIRLVKAVTISANAAEFDNSGS